MKQAFSVTVEYPVTTATIRITAAEYALVHDMMSSPDETILTAIRFIRRQYGLGLKEAKDICEAIAKSPMPRQTEGF